MRILMVEHKGVTYDRAKACRQELENMGYEVVERKTLSLSYATRNPDIYNVGQLMVTAASCDCAALMRGWKYDRACILFERCARLTGVKVVYPND